MTNTPDTSRIRYDEGCLAAHALNLVGDRWALLVAPYSLPRLGELLYAKDHVPGSLRFHGEGGYLLLPPSAKDAGRVRWERPPAETPGGPALPEIGAVLDALVDTLNETGVNATDL